MKSKFLFVALLALFALPAASLQAKTLRAEVNGMVCAFCTAAIEKRLKALDATAAIYVNLKQRLVAVDLKDGKTLAPAQFAQELRLAGYDVVKVGESAESVGQLRVLAQTVKRGP